VGEKSMVYLNLVPENLNLHGNFARKNGKYRGDILGDAT
jgi:hypothetical protein